MAKSCCSCKGPRTGSHVMASQCFVNSSSRGSNFFFCPMSSCIYTVHINSHSRTCTHKITNLQKWTFRTVTKILKAQKMISIAVQKKRVNNLEDRSGKTTYSEYTKQLRMKQEENRAQRLVGQKLSAVLIIRFIREQTKRLT